MVKGESDPVFKNLYYQLHELDSKLAPTLTSSTSELDQIKFREQMFRSFSLDELQTLCADIEVEFDDIPGENSRSGKVRELYLYPRS